MGNIKSKIVGIIAIIVFFTTVCRWLSCCLCRLDALLRKDRQL